MGIDWEGILGCDDGDMLQDYYDDNIPDDDYSFDEPDMYDDDDNDDYDNDDDDNDNDCDVFVNDEDPFAMDPFDISDEYPFKINDDDPFDISDEYPFKINDDDNGVECDDRDIFEKLPKAMKQFGMYDDDNNSEYDDRDVFENFTKEDFEAMEQFKRVDVICTHFSKHFKKEDYKIIEEFLKETKASEVQKVSEKQDFKHEDAGKVRLDSILSLDAIKVAIMLDEIHNEALRKAAMAQIKLLAELGIQN